MKHFILLFCLISFIASAGTFQELKDSTMYYQNKRQLPTALEWAKKAYDYSLNNFERTDTNNLKALKNLATLYFYTSKFDSAIKYQKMHLKIAEETLDELDDKLSESMNNLAVFYQFSGNNEGAEKYFEKSLDKTRQIYKEDHPNLAKSIGNVAVFYKRIGKMKKAESLFLESVKMSRRIYQEPHEELAKSLNNFASFYLEISNFELAEKYILEAYEVYSGLFDENDDRLAMVLNNLGTFYSSISNYTQSLTYLNKALEIRRKFYDDDHHNLALSLLNSGETYLKLNKYNLAGSLLKESSEMFERIYNDNNEFVAFAYKSYATALFSSGNYNSSGEYLNKSIEIFENNYSAKYEQISDAYNSKAYFLEQRGFYKEAIINYKKALSIINKSEFPRKSFKVTILNNIGKMYYILNDESQSIRYFKKSLSLAQEIYDNNQLEFLRIYGNISNYYIKYGNYSLAEKYLSKSSDLYENLFKETNIHKIKILMNYAYFYKQKGDYTASQDYYTKALNEIEQFMHGEINTKFKIRHNLNSLYLITGNIEKAEVSVPEIYNEFTDYFPKINIEYLKILNHMTQLFIKMEEPARAYKYLNESLDITYSIINDYFPVLSDYERSQFFKSFKESFYLSNKFVINNYESEPEYAGFLLNKQINTKGLLLSTSSIFKNELSESTDTVLIGTYNKWRDAKEYIARIYLKSNQELEQTGIKLDSLTEYANNLEKELTEKSKSFEKIKPIQQIDYKDIQSKLAENEAAVEIIKIAGAELSDNVIEIDYAALVLKKNSIYPELIVFDNGSELETSYLDIYKKELRNDDDDKQSYGNYWGKIARKLSGIEKVYISPDGIYNQINLSTLKNPETEKYLYEEIDITILTNISEIIDMNENKEIKQNTDFVFFGNPDFNYKFGEEAKDIFVQTSAYNTLDSTTRGGIELYPLSHTEEEINGIAEIINDKNYQYITFLDTSATEEAVKLISKPKVLHLSTHGYFLKDMHNSNLLGSNIDITRFNENPLLRSMLFFTGSANTLNDSLFNRQEDGILTALEAQNLDLRNTELAVLAACETGLGEIISGEGVYGLQRAFIQAGAESIIMSLWKANDKATKELMVNFYKEWLSGKSKQQAFESAQNIIREKFRYPYFWGAFVMIGE